jgi:DNA repair protein RadC
MKNREVSSLQDVSQNIGLQNNKEVLFIDKNNVLLGQWVCSIVGQYTRALAYVRSIAGSALECM